MIKTKEFMKLQLIERGKLKDSEFILDKDINNFLKENNIKEIIDIKHSKQIEFKERDLYLLSSVLVIYKTEK